MIEYVDLGFLLAFASSIGGLAWWAGRSFHALVVDVEQLSARVENLEAVEQSRVDDVENGCTS